MKFKLPSTFHVLMFLALLAGAWEFWTICNREKGDTFSATLRDLGREQPFIVLAAGLVCGHLFWPLIDAREVSETVSEETHSK